MLIGAFEEKSGELKLLMVKESLIRSLFVEEDMCPANTLGLYSADEKRNIGERNGS